MSLPNLINVLDHGFVRLVDWMGGDLSIVRAARNSHNAAWRTGEDEGKDERLIQYLMQHRHTTPFEAVTITFEVKAPIFVLRQWHRHRTQTYNEVSARYSELPEEYYVPEVEVIGKQSASTKQARVIDTDEDNKDMLKYVRSVMKVRNAASFDAYHMALQHGIPRELARTVLPVATYSKMFMTVNLHNLFHFLRLRLHPHAQYEIRVYAEAILELITPIAPVAVAAFKALLADENPETAFFYIEETEGDIEAYEVDADRGPYGIIGWMSESCKEDDEALLAWMKTAKLGQTFDHRLGIMIKIRKD